MASGQKFGASGSEDVCIVCTVHTYKVQYIDTRMFPTYLVGDCSDSARAYGVQWGNVLYEVQVLAFAATLPLLLLPAFSFYSC